jgi:hypothetical protein
MPDRDYVACAGSEIADITSDLTIIGGRVVYGAGDFARHDQVTSPPAMPDPSPVRSFGGYAAWADPTAKHPALRRKLEPRERRRGGGPPGLLPTTPIPPAFARFGGQPSPKGGG